MSAALIRAQLEAIKKSLQYSFVNGKDDAWVTTSLADLLSAAGLADIRDLRREIRSVDLTIPARVRQGSDEFGTSVPIVEAPARNVQSPFEIWWNARTFENLPRVVIRTGKETANRLINASPIGAPDLRGNFTYTPGIIATLDPRPGDRMIYRVYVQFLTENVPFFIFSPRVKQSPGVIKQAFAAIAPVAPLISLGLGMFAPGVGTAIGQAIVGTSAGAGLASAVGNAVLGTILSGGNVKAAMINAAAGFAGGALGGKVAMALESPIAGNIASAATAATLTGGDPEEAVKRAILQSGSRQVVKG